MEGLSRLEMEINNLGQSLYTALPCQLVRSRLTCLVTHPVLSAPLLPEANAVAVVVDVRPDYHLESRARADIGKVTLGRLAEPPGLDGDKSRSVQEGHDGAVPAEVGDTVGYVEG